MSYAKRASFLSIYLLLCLPLIGYALGGWYNYMVIGFVFFLIPCVDYWFVDDSNPSTSEYQELLHERYFRWITFLYVPVQLGTLAYALYAVTTHDLTWFEWFGFALSVGMVTGGVGITVAHELMHKNNTFQQTLSKILLAAVCYGHFFVEHIRGHHVNVATPNDPASARYNETLYRFLPRTLIGSYKSAWHLELVRLGRKNKTLWGIHNNFWWIIGAPVAICITLLAVAGFSTMVFFLIQSFCAIIMLEIVNYVEHYGLARKQLPDGRYERVSPRHSWNANHWLTNSLLFHLQRHSDHHTHSGRPYQVLRHLDESPQLPVGYPGMIVLAIIPPLWFKFMNPKVDAYNSQSAA